MSVYMQSLLTAEFIGSMFTEKGRIPSYEDLFESDTEEYKQKKLQLETAKLKELAENVNKQRRQNGRRETES